MAARERYIPMVVACPVFLQNLDTSIMATALPSIASALQVQTLHLNLAITSYLLSLAVFLPLSGWCAERFGAKRVFCWAIALFSVGSALCGAANSLPQLVVFRVIQGLGGALMVPVGRLILLRSVPREQMVTAMVWFTVPPTIGRMIGPLVGGALVTWTSWRWIFLINIPFGLIGILLAAWLIDDEPRDGPPPRFDLLGFVLLALGLTCLLGALETAGKSVVSPSFGWGVAGLGAAALVAYYHHGRRNAASILDLGILRFRTYYTSVVGGTPLRIAIGASPFLLPLMLQLGFGLSPLASGLLTVASALGSLATRTIMKQVIHRVSFRSLLLGTTTFSSVAYICYGQFTPETPHALIFVVLLLGGLVNSMGMVALQTLGYSDIPKQRMSHASTLASMAQQLSLSFGVTLGAGLVGLAAWWHDGDATVLAARDFSPAFVVIGLITLVSLVFFLRLDRNEGAGLR